MADKETKGPKPKGVTDVPEPSNVRPPDKPVPEKRPPVADTGSGSGSAVNE